MKNKVVLGLSGGVDSAVAARILMEKGYEVYPLYLQIGLTNSENGLTNAEDARRVAEELGLPFAEKDISQELEEKVCVPFAEAYRQGRTPLPCAVCNTRVKFPALLAYASEIGADYVATGHYARVADDRSGRSFLLRSVGANDQSYMLARLSKEQIARCVFPLGGYEKSEIREMAEDFGLSVAEKPDSMEICFVPDNDYAAWLDRRGDMPPEGNFVDKDGKILGRHKGVHHYTIGQGSGLGISGPHKYYVAEIRPEGNEVVLSDGSDLFTHQVRCGELNWLSIDQLTGPKVVTARFRHSKDEAAAVIFPQPDGTVLAETGGAVRAPTPGQLAVFYEGELVVGSGWILG